MIRLVAAYYAFKYRSLFYGEKHQQNYAWHCQAEKRNGGRRQIQILDKYAWGAPSYRRKNNFKIWV